MTALSTVLFDMIDTLVRFDRQRLPTATIGGRSIRTSAGRLHAELAAVLPEVTLDAFYEAFLWSYQEADRRRAATHREVPAPERFRLVYERLGVGERADHGLTERLLALHMAALLDAADPVEGRGETLEWLAGRYRLGVVSNFDYSPTIERLLAMGGIRHRFEVVVVSDQVGWRKPSPRIFEEALTLMGVSPGECLYVGDRPDIDVAGAREAGMMAAWFNPDALPLPGGLADPHLEIRALPELVAGLRPPPEIAPKEIT